MNDGMKLCVALFTSFSLLPYFTFRFFFFFFFFTCFYYGTGLGLLGTYHTYITFSVSNSIDSHEVWWWLVCTVSFLWRALFYILPWEDCFSSICFLWIFKALFQFLQHINFCSFLFPP